MSVFSSYKHVAVVHFTPVFALGADCRPDGYNRLDVHFLELVAHGLRVGPVLGVKLEVALLCPVEEVDDDSVNRDTAALVLSCDFQEYVLRLIAALALPEAGSPLGHHWAVACKIGIGCHDILGGVSYEYDKVRLISAVRYPHGVVKGGFASTGSGVVPKEAVAERGVVNGDYRLRVVVNKLSGRSLTVKGVLLLLTESVNVLAVVGVEGEPDTVVVALCVEVSHAVVAVIFSAEYLFALAEEGEFSAPIVGGGYFY